MTTQFVKFSFVIAILFAFVACDKTDDLGIDTTDSMTTTAEDLGTSENLFNDLLDQVEEQLELGGTSGKTGEDGCITRTWTNEVGTFPNTLTIDFGEGCTGPGGRTRSGQIIVEISDYPANAGATKTITPVNYFVDEAQVEGTKTLTNNGLDENGNPSFTKTVTDGKITFADGSAREWESTHTRTQINGTDTEFRTDDVFSITGNSSGVSRNGETYSAEIIEPLIKRANCKWIVSGVKSITKDDTTRSMDFGDGGCNRFAEVTLADGTVLNVILPK